MGVNVWNIKYIPDLKNCSFGVTINNSPPPASLIKGTYVFNKKQNILAHPFLSILKTEKSLYNM